MRSLASLALTLLLSGCALFGREEALVRVDRARDFDTYPLRRVGVLPFGGEGLEPEERRAQAEAFATALAREAGFEVVVLDEHDLDGVPPSEPFRRGWTKPATSLELGNRYGLDGIVIGEIRRAQRFPPQRLDVSVDLIALETGLPIWTAAVELDAGDRRVRDALERWYHDSRRSSDPRGERFELYLLAPRLFFEFASAEIARGW
jgi:hypothetical protein